jgi:hypothetical protein
MQEIFDIQLDILVKFMYFSNIHITLVWTNEPFAQPKEQPNLNFNLNSVTTNNLNRVANFKPNFQTSKARISRNSTTPQLLHF